MKTWTKYQTFSHAILLILLVVDLAQSLLILTYDDLLNPSAKIIYGDQLKFWVIALYGVILFGSFPLIVLVIRLNQDRLQKLNMDKFYVVFLMASGLIVLYILPYNLFAVIALIYVVYAFFDNKVKFGTLNDNVLRMFLLTAIVYAGTMICTTGFFGATMVNLRVEQSLRRFTLELVPSSIYEEAVYRGMLYMFLKDLGVSETRTFFIQAFLFWIGHISYLLNSPLFFWVILPILSLMLGYLAIRSKSLTPSTIAHILYNTIAEFVAF